MAGQMWEIKAWSIEEGGLQPQRRVWAPSQFPWACWGGPPSGAEDTGSRSQGLRSTTTQLWLCSVEMHIVAPNPVTLLMCQCVSALVR